MRRLKVLGWRIASLLLVLGLHVMVLASILAGPANGPALDLPEAPVVTVALIESAPEPMPLPAEVVTEPVKTVKPKPKPKKKNTARTKLIRFLQGGGTLVVCGHVFYPFLPELTPFISLAVNSVDSYRVWRVAEHPTFAGVNTDDLTFRKGVAGFYGRGHNPPPPYPRCCTASRIPSKSVSKTSRNTTGRPLALPLAATAGRTLGQCPSGIKVDRTRKEPGHDRQ